MRRQLGVACLGLFWCRCREVVTTDHHCHMWVCPGASVPQCLCHEKCSLDWDAHEHCVAELCAKGTVCLLLQTLRKSTVGSPTPVYWKPCHEDGLVMQLWTGSMCLLQLPGTLQQRKGPCFVQSLSWAATNPSGWSWFFIIYWLSQWHGDFWILRLGRVQDCHFDPIPCPVCGIYPVAI